MKSLITISLLIILGVYLIRKLSKRKYNHDNLGRRSGKQRRKTFHATKNRGRRSNRDRRTQKDRRQLLRFK